MLEPLYFDHAATTPVRPEVVEAMIPYLGPRFGNPSSTHRWGREARAALDEARERVARCLGAKADEVCFTSGGTEADNLAVLGAFHAMSSKGRKTVVTTPIEHKAVLAAAHQAAREGGVERLLRMTPSGQVEAASYTESMTSDVAVVSVMWVNNETGSINAIPELAQQAKAAGALFHTDGVQAFGKLEVNTAQLAVDYLTISGHKIGAPKGTGTLFIRRGAPLEPLFHGGSQDRGRRPGTENVAFAVGLALAAEMTVAEREVEHVRLGRMRDRLEAALKAAVPDLIVHGADGPRAVHVLNVSAPGTDAESMLMALDLAGIACSGGSACQSGSVEPSHVLAALGVRSDIAAAAVRLSLGVMTNDAAIDRVALLFPQLVAKARGLAVA